MNLTVSLDNSHPMHLLNIIGNTQRLEMAPIKLSSLSGPYLVEHCLKSDSCWPSTFLDRRRDRHPTRSPAIAFVVCPV